MSKKADEYLALAQEEQAAEAVRQDGELARHLQEEEVDSAHRAIAEIMQEGIPQEEAAAVADVDSADDGDQESDDGDQESDDDAHVPLQKSPSGANRELTDSGWLYVWRANLSVRVAEIPEIHATIAPGPRRDQVENARATYLEAAAGVALDILVIGSSGQQRPDAASGWADVGRRVAGQERRTWKNFSTPILLNVGPGLNAAGWGANPAALRGALNADPAAFDALAGLTYRDAAGGDDHALADSERFLQAVCGVQFPSSTLSDWANAINATPKPAGGAAMKPGDLKPSEVVIADSRVFDAVRARFVGDIFPTGFKIGNLVRDLSGQQSVFADVPLVVSCTTTRLPATQRSKFIILMVRLQQ